MKVYLSPVTKPGRWCHFWPSIFLLSANKAILCPLSCFTHHPLFSQLYLPPQLSDASLDYLPVKDKRMMWGRSRNTWESDSVFTCRKRKSGGGKKSKFLFHYVIIALRASLSVLISVLQVCAVHVWSWKRAAVDGLKSGVWASHPVCIFLKDPDRLSKLWKILGIM